MIGKLYHKIPKMVTRDIEGDIGNAADTKVNTLSQSRYRAEGLAMDVSSDKVNN